MNTYPPIRGIMIPQGQETIFGADPVPNKPGYVREMFAYWKGKEIFVAVRVVQAQTDPI